MSQMIWLFDRFRLDPANASLFRDDEQVNLAPKLFGLLCCLVERAGRLVDKGEIYDCVWSHRFVSESTLKGRINELRNVLGDDPKAPRFIATVERKGYRFIAKVRQDSTASVVDPVLFNVLSPHISKPSDIILHVGREAVLGRLGQLWEIAKTGRRQLAFVLGEAGIGKTTLLEMFVERIADRGIGLLWGRCVEHFGVGEALMPLLEALEYCCRKPNASDLIARLRRHAPTWLAQLPSVIDPVGRQVLQREILGATQMRMLREFAEFAEQLSLSMPLLLLLEDLHWSDLATLDLLSLLQCRNETAALFIVATYRPEDALRTRHPVEAVRQEAQVHDRGVEIVLNLLSQDEVEHYIERRFYKAFAEGAAEAVHRRSGGHPLFMVKLLDYLAAQGSFEKDETKRLVRDEILSCALPSNLQQLIAWQFERLKIAEQELLEAASVVGSEWSAALIAAVLGQGVQEIETNAENLVRGRHWLHGAGSEEWPDGTIAGRFAFGHALYEEALYQRVPPARRILWHRRVAERLEQAYVTHIDEVAAPIASHFERARDKVRAVGYLQLAARYSARRFANREALEYLDHALELLGPEPSETRLDILQQSGAVRRAMGDMEGAIRVLETMRQCAHMLGHGIAEVRALIDLSRVYNWIDRHHTLELSVEAVALSERVDDPITRLLTQATRAGWAFYLEGWQDSYAAILREALAAARLIGNPVILSTRLSFHTMLEAFASNYRLANEAAEEGLCLAESLGDGYLFYQIRYFQSWSLLHMGEWGKALKVLREGLKAAERNQALPMIRNALMLMALLHCEALRFEQALDFCEQAIPLLSPRSEVIATSLFGIASGKAYLGRGESTKALAFLEAVLEQAEDRIMDWFFYLPLHCTLSECWIAQNDRMRAREHARILKDLAARPPERTYLALAHGLLTRIALAEGDFEEAESEIGQALAIVGKAEVPLATWRIHATAAEFEICRGHPREAEQHRERSTEIFRTMQEALERQAEFGETRIETVAAR